MNILQISLNDNQYILENQDEIQDLEKRKSLYQLLKTEKFGFLKR